MDRDPDNFDDDPPADLPYPDCKAEPPGEGCGLQLAILAFVCVIALLALVGAAIFPPR